jgi:hypothetical protein
MSDQPDNTQDITLNRAVAGLISNAFSSRQRWIEQQCAKKVDVDGECGYPVNVSPENYRDLYNRLGVAKKVVNIYPDESWEEDPEIVEDEDPENVTEFEQAVLDLDARFGIWSVLHRADQLSGIGRFGLLLIGLNDGLETNLPVEGLQHEKEGITAAEHEVLFLRTVSEESVEVATWETNPANPRFGRPILYTVRLNMEEDDTNEPQFANLTFHWTRVLHLADNLQSSEVYGEPRMRDVYNHLLDIKKIAGSSGEMFWRASVTGLALETLPNYEDAQFDRDTLTTELDAYQAGLSRTLAIEGVKINTIAPEVTDPTPHLKAQLRLTASSKSVPWRIFMGSEEAKLAADADSKAWKQRMKRRQTKYITPRIIRPFLDRMIAVRVVPEPASYEVQFPDLLASSAMEKADLALKWTEALSKYVQAQVHSIIPPMEYLTTILGMDDKEATAIMDAAMGAADDSDLSPEEYLTEVLGATPEQVKAIMAMAPKEEVEPAEDPSAPVAE